MVKTLRFDGGCDAFTSRLSEMFRSLENDELTDMEFVCADGRVRAHQCIFAPQSPLLNAVMTCRATLEFDKVDWNQEAAFLCSRRKSDQDIIIFIPDFKVKAMTDVLSCLYTGTVTVKHRTDLQNFKDLMDCLNVETVDISSLEITNRRTKTQTKRKLEEEGPSHGASRQPKKVKSPTKPDDIAQNSITKCDVCESVLDLGDANFNSGRKYIVHLLSHLRNSIFNDIPELKKYYCPYGACKKASFTKKFSFLIHVAWVHREIAPRIEKRIPESKGEERRYLQALIHTMAREPNLKLNVPSTIANGDDEGTRRQHTDDELNDNLECVDCQVKFNDCDVTKHLWNYHKTVTDNKIRCLNCGILFVDLSVYEFLTRFEEHDCGAGIYECQNCSITFRSSGALKHFSRFTHPNNNCVKCTECDFTIQCSRIQDFWDWRISGHQCQGNQSPPENNSVSDLYSSINALNNSLLSSTSQKNEPDVVNIDSD